MSAPPENMATLTASLERSLRNCSLDHAAGLSRSDGGFPDLEAATTTKTLVDLNSHVSLPYQWEQCLDLQTGEIYYKNWRNGRKAKEDPRLLLTTTTGYSTEEEEDDEDEEEEDEQGSHRSGSESEGSSTSPPPPPSNPYRGMLQAHRELDPEDVLVVAGCKICLMYYMVPKQVVHCPKCAAHLLHFDRPFGRVRERDLS